MLLFTNEVAYIKGYKWNTNNHFQTRELNAFNHPRPYYSHFKGSLRRNSKPEEEWANRFRIRVMDRYRRKKKTWFTLQSTKKIKICSVLWWQERELGLLITLFLIDVKLLRYCILFYDSRLWERRVPLTIRKNIH